MNRSSRLFGILLATLATPGFAQLQVKEAQWGVVAGGGRVGAPSCDATPQMSKACNGKTFCQVYVDNRYLCGDPAQGRQKSLDVSYTCGGEAKVLGFPETAQAVLRCDVAAPPPVQAGSKSLSVSSARWGVAGAAGKVATPSCDATAQMATACNGKSFCQVYVDNRYLCADPAQGRQKSLDVNFSCGGKQESLSFPETAQAVLRCN